MGFIVLLHMNLFKMLSYLDFDYSEDEQGIGTWDAMACVIPDRVSAVAHEIGQVLTWATQSFTGRQGALDDGGDWDYDLQAQDDEGQPLVANFDAERGQVTLATSPYGRTTVTLSLAGSPQFGAAFEDAFGVVF